MVHRRAYIHQRSPLKAPLGCLEDLLTMCSVQSGLGRSNGNTIFRIPLVREWLSSTALNIALLHGACFALSKGLIASQKAPKPSASSMDLQPRGQTSIDQESSVRHGGSARSEGSRGRFPTWRSKPVVACSTGPTGASPLGRGHAFTPRQSGSTLLHSVSSRPVAVPRSHTQNRVPPPSRPYHGTKPGARWANWKARPLESDRWDLRQLAFSSGGCLRKDNSAVFWLVWTMKFEEYHENKKRTPHLTGEQGQK